jgi:hypothetical protein
VHTRKHVFSDLQPYICTYSDCQLHEYFFDNLDDWFRHESRTHRVEWFCNTDSHPSFVDRKDFLDHMHAVHSEPLDETQLLNLHHGFQRPSNAYAGTCTLCGQYANRLKSHLARHLQQLALFAIPQTDYMDPIEEDDTSSNAARQDIGALSIIASTRAVSNPWWHESGSEVSADSLGHINNKSRSKAPADDQYSNQYEEPGSVPRDDIREEVDTSWDLITPKFKDARIGIHGNQEAETPNRHLQPFFPGAVIYEEPIDAAPPSQLKGSFSRLFDEPQEVVPRERPIDLSTSPVSWGNSVPVGALGHNDPYYPPPVFSGDAGGPTYEPSPAPSDVRTGRDISVPPIQPPGVYSDSNPTEGADRKAKRTWRQRLSKAILIGGISGRR